VSENVNNGHLGGEMFDIYIFYFKLIIFVLTKKKDNFMLIQKIYLCFGGKMLTKNCKEKTVFEPKIYPKYLTFLGALCHKWHVYV
jgi:hypothetical protein